MTTLQITIRDEVWPDVARVLVAAFGPVPEGVPVKVWAAEVAAGFFAERVAELMQPPRIVAPQKRIRPSRVRS